MFTLLLLHIFPTLMQIPSKQNNENSDTEMNTSVAFVKYLNSVIFIISKTQLIPLVLYTHLLKETMKWNYLK